MDYVHLLDTVSQESCKCTNPVVVVVVDILIPIKQLHSGCMIHTTINVQQNYLAPKHDHYTCKVT